MGGRPRKYIFHTVALFGATALFWCVETLGCLWFLIRFHHHAENHSCFVFIWPSLFILSTLLCKCFCSMVQTPRQQIKVEDGGK